MASDVFAFGMTVLELLTMKAPSEKGYLCRIGPRSGVLSPRPEEPEVVPWMSG